MNRYYFPFFLILVLLISITGYLAWRSIREVSVLVEWTTASELDTAGFNLYRSLAAAGPFEKVNPSLIPTNGDPLTGGDYQYEDKSVQPGMVYFYQLEEVELDGGGGRFGPISVHANAGIPYWVPTIPIVMVICLAVVWLFRRRRDRSVLAAADR